MARIIARLDIKGEHLIKGVRLEGLRKLGNPNVFATRYYEEGIDELIYMDAVASLYGRNHLADIVQKTAENVFIPLTVGGGIRSEQDAQAILSSGADKIAINTAAIQNPSLITSLANRFGSQCVVLSIEAKRQQNGWEAYTENGRERSGISVIDWAKEAASLGAGEILLTSVDQEGTRQGFDTKLTKSVAETVDIPVIASGGGGLLEHIEDVLESTNVDAVALADFLHYQRGDIPSIKKSIGLPERDNHTVPPLKNIDSIVVVDYGMGNLRSVYRACSHFAKHVAFAKTKQDIEDAHTIVLPGVGAFQKGMEALHERDLSAPIKDAADSGKKIIGICLGMQMLFSRSHEFGLYEV